MPAIILLAFLAEADPLASAALYVGALLTVGFVLTGAGLFLVWRARALGVASRTWPTAPGTITASRVVEHDADGIEKFVAELAYRYTASGKTFTGDRLRFGSYAGSREAALRDVEKYPEGAHVDVRYAPRQPQTSVLEPGAHAASAAGVALAAGGAAILCVAVAVVLFV